MKGAHSVGRRRSCQMRDPLLPIFSQLARAFSDLVRGRLVTDDRMPLNDEAVRLRIQAVLAERGRLTNAEVRRLSGYSRTQTLRLMRALQEEELVAFKGRGRAAHYVPGNK